MTFTIQDTLMESGDSVYYDEGFRTVIEMHLPILRTTSIQSQNVSPHLVHKFEGDFYGLLRNIGFDRFERFWIIMRVNNMEDPSQFGRFPYFDITQGKQVSIIVPNVDIISRLVALYKTTQTRNQTR